MALYRKPAELRDAVASLKNGFCATYKLFASGGSEQGSFNGIGNGDQYKPVFRIDKTFPAFIDDSYVAVLARSA